MNLVPLLMVFFLHERPGDRDMRVDRWNRGGVREPCAGELRIVLRDSVVANEFENKIPAFI